MGPESVYFCLSYLSAGVNASIRELLESTSSLDDEPENSSALRGGAREKTMKATHHFMKNRNSRKR